MSDVNSHHSSSINDCSLFWLSVGFNHIIGQDTEGAEVKSGIKADDFVFVIGYGRVGKMVSTHST